MYLRLALLKFCTLPLIYFSPGRVGCLTNRPWYKVKTLPILLLLSGCVAYLLIWGVPSGQNRIAEYERMIRRKLDDITAQRHQLQTVLDNLRMRNESVELKDKVGNVNEDRDYEELSVSTEESEVRVMKYVVEEIPMEKRYKHLITVNIPSGGRLGNLMFSYASMYGIAMKNYMVASLDYDNVLLNYFNVSAKPIGPNDTKHTWAVYTEAAPSIYISHETDRLNYETNIQLYGFFQSWRYFGDYEKEIRKQFTFNNAAQKTAKLFIEKALNKYYYNNTRSDPSNVVFVGIHIRRGDMLDLDNFDQGYTVAPPSYLDMAMGFFEARYEHLIFIVCSDDIEWSKDVLEKRTNTIVLYSQGRKAIEDLAILSNCNHSIMTIGTFGWWGAWLAGGTTIYYNEFPQKFSYLSQGFSSKDYYPPKWIGLS